MGSSMADGMALPRAKTTNRNIVDKRTLSPRGEVLRVDTTVRAVAQVGTQQQQPPQQR